MNDTDALRTTGKQEKDGKGCGLLDSHTKVGGVVGFPTRNHV
jgi:hypothetical protein